MGFRYRKSIKMGPFRLNLSKSGIGYSVGVKGYRVTKTATGRTRTTVSIPGTGISHVTETKTQPRPAAKPVQVQEQEKKPAPKWVKWALAAFAVYVVVALFVGCAADEPAPSVSVVPPAVSAVDVPDLGTEPAPEPEPEPEPLPEKKPEPIPEPKPAPEPVPEPEPEPVPEPNPEPVPEPAPEPAPEPEPKQEPVTPAPAPDPEPEKEEPAAYTYVGNKNSKVFHQSNCGSVTNMKEKNKVPLESRDAAIASGFKPCNNCKP